MKGWSLVKYILLPAVLAVGLVLAVQWLPPLLIPAQQTVAPVETIRTEPTEPEQTAPPPLPLPEVDITWATYPQERELTARQAFVYDCDNGKYLYILGHTRHRLWPASITKLMSVHVILQHLQPQQQVTVQQQVLDILPEDAAVSRIRDGEVFTVQMLLKAMLWPSGNDAAYTLAVETGRVIAGDPQLPIQEAVAVFVEQMNLQAQEHGMTDTHFVNPDGYHHEAHCSSMQDMMLLAQLVMENPTVMEICRVVEEEVQPLSGQQKKWHTTNLLVDPESEYYCPYTIGLKTGQTEAAGSCLLSAFDVEGRRFVIGVFGSPEFTDKLDDTIALFNEKVIKSP